MVADALDPDQVAEAVGRANPEVIVHQLTAIGSVDMRHFDRDFALTNRLRTEGTDHLLSAGRAVGVRRFVAQSAVYGFYARTGGAVKSEDDPFDPSPPREIRESAAAIRHLEEAVLGAEWTEGIVLRYGAFYGPGTSLSAGRRAVRDGPQAQVPAGRQWRRGVVVRPHRRRRRGDRRRGRPRQSWYLQRRGRRSGTGGGVAASVGADARSQEADARASLRRADVRRRDRGGVHDRHPRRVEREGQARAGLAPGASELAGGFAAA